MAPKLSILICTLDERKKEFSRMMDIINPQLTDDVEVLTNCDNKVKIIGTKRNELVEQATGEYIVFVDDDDKIPDYYIEEILKAIETKPDVVGIKGIITTKGTNPRVFIHSLAYDHWFSKDGIYYRCPNHWNPVKKSIAVNVKFPEINYGEDQQYSMALRPLLVNEVFIQKYMYYYCFDPDKSIAIKRAREDKLK